MGMDVCGRNPSAPDGEYFRASIWKWPLLVKIITLLCPWEASACKKTGTPTTVMGSTAHKRSHLARHSRENFDQARSQPHPLRSR
jgi:hypothetical protein